jgi:hypothetical protein
VPNLAHRLPCIVMPSQSSSKPCLIFLAPTTATITVQFLLQALRRSFSRASVFPTLTIGLDGGRDDPRAAAFVDKLEAGMATKLAVVPERMVIPLGMIVLVKEPR